MIGIFGAALLATTLLTPSNAWEAHPSHEDVKLKITTEGKATRLDYDFGGGGGYAIARLPLKLDLPSNYEFTFRIRGEGPPQTLEFKLLDPTAENVWWNVRRPYRFPDEWTRIRIKKRHLQFAWGPQGGGDIRRTSGLEIVITAAEGGTGTVWIDDLAFTPLEPDRPYTLTPAIKKSAQRYEVDFKKRRELGGLAIDWQQTPRNFDVSYSMDGKSWERVWRAQDVSGPRSYVVVPEGETRYVRIDAPSVRAVQFLEPKETETKNAMWARIAKDARRGLYPKYLTGEQSYWTIVGAPEDTYEALINEEGTIDIDPIRFSIEPFIDQLTWADAKGITQSLADGELPIPTVTRDYGDVQLQITTMARGQAGHSVLWTRYRVTSPRKVKLHLAIRPLQVNPSWQFLAMQGGAAEIRTIALKDNRVVVNDVTSIIPLTPPASILAARFDQGEATQPLTALTDAFGAASALLTYDIEAGTHDVVITIPFYERSATSGGSFDEELAAEITEWRNRLGRVAFHLPKEAAHVAHAIRSNLAYILINMDGPSIQPGSRSYDRSWIRDGSLTSSALLRLAHPEEVKRFIEWYAQYQRPDGYVPCCVGRRGADPVPEHDSHGQFIYLIKEYYDFTKDQAFLQKLWPNVERAVGFIDSQRAQETGAFAGLMPASISHEGYSAKPMHSYWDDFFVLKGLKDAVDIAHVLGKRDEEQKFARSRDEFRRDLYASIDRAMSAKGIDFIPGSAELGDFDATSTTTALNPGGEVHKAMGRTFERYWEEFVARKNGSKAWDAYTPYEWRTVGSFVRLGQPERAHEILDWFFTHSRPPAFNHWAEVVFHDPKKPKFIGDMPHTWVGSDFIRSVIDMFAYEREDALVLGAGIPRAWVESGGGVGVDMLRTPYGPLTYSMKKDGNRIAVRVEEGLSIPAGGIVIVSPIDRRETTVRALPAELNYDN